MCSLFIYTTNLANLSDPFTNAEFMRKKIGSLSSSLRISQIGSLEPISCAQGKSSTSIESAA